MPSLIPPKTEKDRQRQMRFYAVSYGGMGLMALTEMLDFYTDWQWVITLGACVRIVVTVYILVRLVFKPYIPGYVEKDAGQRGAKDYRKDACLDLDTFTMILVRIVLYYNNYHYLCG